MEWKVVSMRKNVLDQYNLAKLCWSSFFSQHGNENFRNYRLTNDPSPSFTPPWPSPQIRSIWRKLYVTLFHAIGVAKVRVEKAEAQKA